MAVLPNAVAAYKQKRFDTAALEAMKAYDAGIHSVPSRAMLNASDKAIIAQNPPQFNAKELAKQLVEYKLIRREPRPVKQPPVAQHPAEQCLVEQRLVAQRRDLDVEIAEAAGFHRAMNIWSNLPRQGIFFSDAQSDLRRQAAKLADLLAPYNIEDPRSLPGKFSGFQSGLRCPTRLSLQTAGPRDLVPQVSYYDEFLNILNRS
ncbi:uncharacterized protein J4E87_010880 [Alternaria ethzedia]|uniref:uncharacterized protein n=1 Tax=Alternaria ethzedia TaxID=181014 RepID=UPI0020C1E899|nr:uncharacterized protein J4E87_010880 [Alternaria ethzedia]KAI4610124.1 hypothetical protein J4E87_010880 [Alternaria ethzedia]